MADRQYLKPGTHTFVKLMQKQKTDGTTEYKFFPIIPSKKINQVTESE